MSLIRCPDCNTMVSDEAEACPKCGYPIKANIENIIENIRSKKMKENLIVLIVSVVIVLIAIIIFSGGEKKESRSQASKRVEKGSVETRKTSKLVFDNPEPSSRQKTLYTKASLNVRTGPGTEYKKIEVLKRFQEVQVIETKGDWAKINHEGQVGWASIKYLFDKNKMLALQKKEKETVEKKTSEKKDDDLKIIDIPCMRECYTEISIRSRNMDEYDIWVESICRKIALKANNPELYDLCVLQGGFLGAALTTPEISDELREKAAYQFCHNCYCF